ncbi:MAG: DUF1611 domain-containing protein [Nitrosomonas sp.]|nr:DUF1611 domain-containing protein [Nitrosomonas sp.]
MKISSIKQERLFSAKISYTPRNLKLESVTTLLYGEDIIPNAGDIFLARVTQLGQHHELELAHGRRSALRVGDEIIVCYGNCYVPDQFEAQVPNHFESCDLVAPSGIAARVNHRYSNTHAPTTIQPIGLLADSTNKRINLKDTALPKLVSLFPLPYTIGVVGTSMNTGRTTTTAMLIRGLTNAGYTVGVAKVTGIGSGHDTWLIADAGSKLTLDFTHAGFPSTYLISPDQIDAIIETLVTHLCVANVNAIVIEVADDLLQHETASLLNSRIFTKTVDSIVFALGDAMGAIVNTDLFGHDKLPVVAIETADATELPILNKTALSSHTVVDVLQIPLQMTVTQALSANETYSNNKNFRI